MALVIARMEELNKKGYELFSSSCAIIHSGGAEVGRYLF